MTLLLTAGLLLTLTPWHSRSREPKPARVEYHGVTTFSAHGRLYFPTGAHDHGATKKKTRTAQK